MGVGGGRRVEGDGGGWRAEGWWGRGAGRRARLGRGDHGEVTRGRLPRGRLARGRLARLRGGDHGEVGTVVQLADDLVSVGVRVRVRASVSVRVTVRVRVRVVQLAGDRPRDPLAEGAEPRRVRARVDRDVRVDLTRDPAIIEKRGEKSGYVAGSHCRVTLQGYIAGNAL